jgi:hypothetical protein
MDVIKLFSEIPGEPEKCAISGSEAAKDQHVFVSTIRRLVIDRLRTIVLE